MTTDSKRKKKKNTGKEGDWSFEFATLFKMSSFQ